MLALWWREVASRHGSYSSHLWVTVLAMLQRPQRSNRPCVYSTDLVDGKFSIESKPGHGTTIRARVPVKAPASVASEAG